MQTYQAVRTRRTSTEILPGSVPDEIIRMVLNAGAWGPTALQRDALNFVIIRNRESIRNITEAIRVSRGADQAHCLVVITAKQLSTQDNQTDEYNITDWEKIYLLEVGASIENMLLTAHEYGFGAIWLAGVNIEELRHELHIPEDLYIVSILAIGQTHTPPVNRTEDECNGRIHLDFFGNLHIEEHSHE